jgi:hypothetical protein
MTQQQIIEAINQLSVAERIALIEALLRGLREEMGSGGAGPAGARETEAVEAGGNGSGEVSLARQLYGALKFDGPPPTDEEVRDIIAEYLSEKYS